MIRRFQSCNRIVLLLVVVFVLDSQHSRVRGALGGRNLLNTTLSRGGADETDQLNFVFRHHFLADSSRSVSAQCARKNLFSPGRRCSDVPTIGRSVVIICRQTKMKIALQSLKWVRAERPSKWPIASSKRKPNIIPIAHRLMCSAAMNATESVDCEKIQATGANPINSTAPRLTAANNTPVTVRN